MIEIIPALLVHDKDTFIAQTRAVEKLVSLVQIDIADGEFVPSTTWADPASVRDSLQIDCELHLMVRDPVSQIRPWVEQEVAQVKRVLVHYESAPTHIADILSQIGSYGWEIGLVLNPETTPDVVEELMEEIDTIMCMGVVPGLQGQPFVPEVVEKIRVLRDRYPHLPIAVDGHVDEETIPDLVAAGATRLGIGSAIFKNNKTPQENITDLRQLIHRLTNE